MQDVMIDLETLSTRSNAAIVAVGAVVINDPDNTFYETISWDSAAAHGHVDMETVKWWIGQGDSARKAVTETGLNINIVLLKLTAWFKSLGEPVRIWGYGAAFDNAVLANAFRECKMNAPWSYRNDMCYRTLSSLYPEVEFERKGTYHNALDDAKSQASHLIKILEVHHGRKNEVKQT